MLKSVLEAVAAARSLVDLVVVVVAFPIARQLGGWVDDRGGAGLASGDTLATALVLGLALLAGVRLGRRALTLEPPRPARAPLGAGAVVPAIAARDPAVEPGAVVRAVAGVPPAPERAPPAGEESPDAPASKGVLDDLRTCMDEVSYTPGTPNVLSMTKYLHVPADASAPVPQRPDEAGRAADGAAGVDVRRRDDGEKTVLEIAGILDALAVPRVRTVFDALAAERRVSVTIDLSSLRLVDSSGVGLVVSLFKRCRSLGGDVRVSGLNGQPLAIFRLLRLDRIFALP